MLRTRLWMGAVLILLTLGVLLLDDRFAPWYPCLFLLVVVLSLGACWELLTLLGPARRPWPLVCYPAVLLLLAANWVPHVLPEASTGLAFHLVLAVFVGVVLLAFVAAMATFQPPETPERADTLTQAALTIFIAAYLGVLPAFAVQLRWLPGDRAVWALATAIFLPKCCDIGAYFTGRLLGRHRMAPVLSPKKTWEGLAGGLLLTAGAAVLLNERGGLGLEVWTALCLGLSLGGAGVLGDLAESLIKRECRQKDASQVMPGFGGVLDVIDSILYAAPLAYLWLR